MAHVWFADTAHTPDSSGQHRPTYPVSITADVTTEGYVLYLGVHGADLGIHTDHWK